MTNLKTQAGLNEVVRFIEKSGLLKAERIAHGGHQHVGC